jgi:hypothetical protein
MKKEHIITKKSPFSGKTNSLTIVFDPADYQKWQEGELIQRALPYLTADEREFLMTGITPEEWNSMTEGEDDE